MLDPGPTGCFQSLLLTGNHQGAAATWSTYHHMKMLVNVYTLYTVQYTLYIHRLTVISRQIRVQGRITHEAGEAEASGPGTR